MRSEIIKVMPKDTNGVVISVFKPIKYNKNDSGAHKDAVGRSEELEGEGEDEDEVNNIQHAHHNQRREDTPDNNGQNEDDEKMEDKRGGNNLNNSQNDNQIKNENDEVGTFKRSKIPRRCIYFNL